MGRHVCPALGPARFLGRPGEMSGSTTPIENPISGKKWSQKSMRKKPKRDVEAKHHRQRRVLSHNYHRLWMTYIPRKTRVLRPHCAVAVPLR